MPTLIKNGKNYSGTSVSLTQAEYDALTETQKNDGTVYFITDSDAVLDASDISVGSGTMEDVVGSIAVIETSPATSAHAVGTYLVYNGQLYKVTSAIAVGETLTVGTNISATNVGSELAKSPLIQQIFYKTSAEIGTTAQAFSVNWQDYDLLIIQAGLYANPYVTCVVPVVAYFSHTNSGNRPILYDPANSVVFEVYQNGNGSIYASSNKSESTLRLKIYGIKFRLWG